MQGLTVAKMYELEQLVMSNKDILCMTETQQKIEKIKINDDLNTIDNMRSEKE